MPVSGRLAGFSAPWKSNSFEIPWAMRHFGSNELLEEIGTILGHLIAGADLAQKSSRDLQACYNILHSKILSNYTVLTDLSGGICPR